MTIGLYNDPLKAVITIFDLLYPGRNYMIFFVGGYIKNLEDDSDPNDYVGWCQSWKEENGDPGHRILLSTNANMNDLPSILIHELSHSVVDGWEHSEEFARVVNSILVPYNQWVVSEGLNLHCPDLRSIVGPRLNIDDF